MRAKSMGVINETQNTYLWRQISAANMRLEEPPSLDFPHEEPRIFPKILKIYFEDYKYSLEDLGQALHIMPSYFEKLYQVVDPSKRQKAKLRVVS
jgi:hypothetical protein